MQENISNKKWMLPFLVIMDIFTYAFKGVKFLFFDLFVLFFNLISGRVDHAYKSAKEVVDREEENYLRKQEEKKQRLLIKEEKYNNLWFVKKKMQKLEKKRQDLLIELQKEGEVRSKEPHVYQYIAKNKNGKVETGTINGYSKLDVNTFLLQDGYIVYEIKSSKFIDFVYGSNSVFAVKMSNKDLLFWLTQLSTYIKSGISLTDSVRILNNQLIKKKHYRKALQSIVYELTMGEAFSNALEKQGNMFPALLINMIKAAEATGELESTLTDMANYYEEINKTRKQMISAITYPSIIMVFAIGVITFIMLYVIPGFVKIYKQSDISISGLTVLIINLSDFLQKNVFMIFAIFISVFVLLYLAYRHIKAFRKAIQNLLMHLPIVGKVMIYNELTIFSKTFASLLANNVFITDSMDILSRITNNEIYKDIMNRTIKNIVKGDKISASFKDHWAIPDVAYYMIVTGESTGQLSQMMKKVSDYYAEMHRSIITNLKAFIEPVLISALALVVGIIILAVIVPMFELMGSIQ